MKRTLVLLSTAAFLGVGCGHTCDYRDVALYWHFPGAAGAAELSCDQAGVASIRITIDGTPVTDDSGQSTFACVLQDVNGNPVQGILLYDFGQQPYQFQVDALDANGNLVYTDQFSYTPTLCGTNTVDRTLTATGADMKIAYSFSPAATCTTPSAQSGSNSTYIWFELEDQSGRVYSSASSAGGATAIPCGAAGSTISFLNAPLGTYTLTRYQEVEIRADRSIVVYHYHCAPDVTLQHVAAGDTFNVPPMLLQGAGGTTSCF